MATSVSAPAVVRRSRRWPKRLLWLAMGGMTVSVFLVTELPLIRPGTGTRAHLIAIRWLIVPHVVAAATALITGAVQFSSRVRRSNLQLHRLTGRVYVGAIFVAGPFALVMAYGTVFFAATVVQAGAWMVTALAAILAARHRHMEAHRQWVVRSYGVTFGFILLHVLKPWHVWGDLSDPDYAMAIVICTFLAVSVPDLVFDWKRLRSHN